MTGQLRLGTISGMALAALCAAYAVVLVIGLATLPSPDQPIADPWFTAMELLILAMAPAMVGLAVALHGWVDAAHRPFAAVGVVFMGLTAGLTSCVHFAVLTLSRHPAFAAGEWSARVFAFRWPSVAYALDILAWDVFFPLAAGFAALAVPRDGPARGTRALLLGSAALAFAGLAGVPLADMRVRNVGILGYVVLFPIAAARLATLFRRAG